MKKFLTLLFALFLGFFMTACSGSTKPYEKTAIEFIEAMYNGKGDKVKKMIYIPKEELKEPGVEEMINGKMVAAAHDAKMKADEYDGLKKVTVLESAHDDSGKRASVRLGLEFKKGTEGDREERLDLIKDGSTWKVALK